MEMFTMRLDFQPWRAEIKLYILAPTLSWWLVLQNSSTTRRLNYKYIGYGWWPPAVYHEISTLCLAWTLPNHLAMLSAPCGEKKGGLGMKLMVNLCATHACINFLTTTFHVLPKWTDDLNLNKRFSRVSRPPFRGYSTARQLASVEGWLLVKLKMTWRQWIVSCFTR